MNGSMNGKHERQIHTPGSVAAAGCQDSSCSNYGSCNGYLDLEPVWNFRLASMIYAGKVRSFSDATDADTVLYAVIDDDANADHDAGQDGAGRGKHGDNDEGGSIMVVLG